MSVKKRLPFLDRLRALTVLAVLVYHVVYLYNTVGVPFPVAQDAGLRAFDLFGYAVYPWFMLLLFVIAGICARYALEGRSGRAFLRAKLDRLLVPGTLGLFVYHWITGYMNVLSGGQMESIPAAVRYSVFVAAGIGPLWFSHVLFLFSALLAVLRRIDRGDALWRLGGRATLPAYLALALLIWAGAQVLNPPVITTYRFGIYGAGYLLGYAVFSHPEAQERLRRARWPLLGLAVALGTAFVLRWFGESYVSDACLKAPLTNAFAWAAVLAALGGAKAWLDGDAPALDWLAHRSFAFYVLHYPVVLFSCGALYALGMPALVRYPLALALELLGTALVYELIRRIPVVRYAVLGIRKDAGKRAGPSDAAF